MTECAPCGGGILIDSLAFSASEKFVNAWLRTGDNGDNVLEDAEVWPMLEQCAGKEFDESQRKIMFMVLSHMIGLVTMHPLLLLGALLGTLSVVVLIMRVRSLRDEAVAQSDAQRNDMAAAKLQGAARLRAVKQELASVRVLQMDVPLRLQLLERRTAATEVAMDLERRSREHAEEEVVALRATLSEIFNLVLRLQEGMLAQAAPALMGDASLSPLSPVGLQPPLTPSSGASSLV